MGARRDKDMKTKLEATIPCKDKHKNEAARSPREKERNEWIKQLTQAKRPHPDGPGLSSKMISPQSNRATVRNPTSNVHAKHDELLSVVAHAIRQATWSIEKWIMAQLNHP